MFRQLLLLIPLWCAAQTAQYPTSVVTDSQLMTAKNQLTTTLTSPMAATDTTVVVNSTTGFSANMLLTVQNEIMQICSVAGANSLNIGHSSCPNADGRGFDGTTAVAHAVNSAAALYIDAWHHNAMKAEMEAVEANTGSVINVRSTGAKCDGTTNDGAAINALIAAAPIYSTIMIPSGANCATSVPIVINRDNITLASTGLRSGLISPLTANTDVIQIGNNVTKRNGITIRDIIIGNPPASTSGYAFNIRIAGLVQIQNVRLYGALQLWRGFNIYQCQFCYVYDSILEGTVDSMAVIGGAPGNLSSDVKFMRNTIDTIGGSPFLFNDYNQGIYFYDNEIYAIHAGWAFDASNKAVLDCCWFFRGNDVDTSATACTASFGSNCDAGVFNLKNQGSPVEITGNAIGGANNTLTSKAVVLVDATVGHFNFMSNNVNALGTNYYGIYSSAFGNISGNTFTGGGANVVLFRQGGGSNFHLSGNKFYSAATGVTVDPVVTGGSIIGNTFDISSLTTPIAFNSSSAAFTIAGNGGCENNIPPIASAATITLPACASKFTITGTTALQTMNGVWNGRTVQLLFSNAAPGGTSAGGTPPTFAYSSTVASGHPLICSYFGSNWVCQ